MNGTTPAGNWTGLFSPGESVRLRFIGAGAQTFFDVRIPELPMTVVHVDGQDIEPVTVDEFRIGPAETYDVIVRPDDRPYTVFAQSMDRSGDARGSLSPRPGLAADVPAVDEPQWLTAADMMGAMAAGDAAVVHARHAKSEYGPSVDMRVDMPRSNLDDPGVGLRGNGRRVLTYADIRTIGGPLDARTPGREVELHLTGNMQRYSWSFDGLEFGHSTPVHMRLGERLRVVLVNDTMMTHPMHLHGLWSELEAPDGEFLARRHTISVQPAQRVSFLVHADAKGGWAWHCHLLFHMDSGMFREVVVS
jgi:FtsP/CotA-like multicopper oxidase with cupredoxin domain